MKLCSFLAGMLALCVGSVANAAFIAIDDTDVDNITISAGDFEGGFTVNGNLLTAGLGNSATITLADSGYVFFGSWNDLSVATGTTQLLFALPGNPTDVTSGVDLTATTDGFVGTVTGGFGGYTGVPYFPSVDPTTLQDGHNESTVGFAFLSVSFTSEPVAAVPEPATLVIWGLGMLGTAVAARRRKLIA